MCKLFTGCTTEVPKVYPNLKIPKCVPELLNEHAFPTGRREHAQMLSKISKCIPEPESLSTNPKKCTWCPKRVPRGPKGHLVVENRTGGPKGTLGGPKGFLIAPKGTWWSKRLQRCLGDPTELLVAQDSALGGPEAHLVALRAPKGQFVAQKSPW